VLVESITVEGDIMEENIKVADEQLSKDTGFKKVNEPPAAVTQESIQTNDLFTSIVHTSFFSPDTR